MGRVRQVSLDPRRTKRVFECLYYHGKDLCAGVSRNGVFDIIPPQRPSKHALGEKISRYYLYMHDSMII
jgi:hypothetical protein